MNRQQLKETPLLALIPMAAPCDTNPAKEETNPGYGAALNLLTAARPALRAERRRERPYRQRRRSTGRRSADL